MSLECSYEGCTFGDTGKCALEHDPATCPNRLVALAAAGDEAERAVSDAGDPVLQSPDELPSFPLSTTLGTEVIEAMMAERYVTVVGILGDPESGKTACLASLYLLVSSGAMQEWSFADSRSLMGFESIARGARQWNEGQPPEQMTLHTEMTDDRVAGFLHLRLRHNKDGRRVDLVLPDLPGEWTKAMVRTARTDRFEFLRSADVLWLVVDGKALHDKEQRQGCIMRVGQLVGRLTGMMEGNLPRLLLVVTHLDAGPPDATVLTRLHAELASHGSTAQVVSVASFAKKEAKVKPGAGIEDLINATVPSPAGSIDFWPATRPVPNTGSYLSYRRRLDD